MLRLLLFSALIQSAMIARADERSAFFEAKIRPVLVAKCYECHSSEAKRVGGELLLDSAERLRRGGESGTIVQQGDADNSLLMEALRHEGLEMPPDERLSHRTIADFEKWINDGAFDPRNETNSVPEGTESDSDRRIDFEAAREFWSFQAPCRHAAPQVEDSQWPSGTIDHFILSRLEKHNLQPNRSADRRTLIRRVTFDLTGLPPTIEEVYGFLSDERPDAYERLVERLLSSPQFGARWARLWLDVARYAEDQAHIVGNNKELFYPNAWRYRDWLIHAFNDDMPFDQFVQRQLAADLRKDDEEHLAALGFLGLGPKYYRRNAPEVMADEWEDRVDTVTRGLLGMTVACARCHDHKYDPIPTEDYYALAGVFASSEMYNRPPKDWKPTEKKKKPDPAITLHVVRDSKPRDLKVHIRGDAFNEGEVVPRRFVSVLSADEVSLQSGSGRIPLANAIASRNNPLTARVIVNRIWGQYFGHPLVTTPSNFGKLGQPPTHPELLDDLAVRFMDAGWSLKWLHQEIVLSATYRQSSNASEASLQIDPANELLGRMSRRRLSVEMWRDAVLSVADQLDSQVGGTSLDVQDPTTRRRTVYSKVSRLELNSMLQLFDYPDPNVHAATRAKTTTPLQKLFTLNSPWITERAEQLSDRLKKEWPDVETRVRSAYELVFAREPLPTELDLAMAFLSQNTESGQEQGERWSQYAQILLAANEMLYLD